MTDQEVMALFDKEFVDENYWEEKDGETKFVAIGNIKQFILNVIQKVRDEERSKEDAYKEYIAFLEKNIGDNAGFLYVHGIQASDEVVKEGERLRAQIKELPPQDTV